MGTPQEEPGEIVTARISPLSPDMRYDEYSREQYLLDLAPLPADAKINDFCQRFAESSSSERSSIRSSLSQGDLYTLITFSRRSAALARRQHAANRVAMGITAMAAMQLDRVDPRDVSSTLSLLYFVANGIGEDAKKQFRAAAMLAEPKSSERILQFLESPARTEGIDRMCLATVQTKEGPSVIHRGIKPYAPTIRLDSVAVEIAELIHLDKYLPQISLAIDLPRIWLQSVDDRALFDVLQRVRAGVTIEGTLRPDVSPDPRHQAFVIFLVEAANVSDTDTLLRLAKAKRANPNDVAILGVSASRLFCLVIARSSTRGKESYETCKSLTRFANGLQAILSKHKRNDAL